MRRSVSVDALRRHLAARRRAAASRLSALRALQETYEALEASWIAPAGGDPGAAFDALYAALRDFAAAPEDRSARLRVLDRAAALARSLNVLARLVGDGLARAEGELRAAIDEVNARAAGIAELNRRLAATESGPDPSPREELRSRRDRLLLELGDLVQVAGIDGAEDGLNVLLGTAYLVRGLEARALVLERGRTNDAPPRPVFADLGTPVEPEGGRIRGLLESRDEGLAAWSRDLDRLASAIGFEFNHAQRAGPSFGFAADTGGLPAEAGLNVLFDGAGAGSLETSGELVRDPDRLSGASGFLALRDVAALDGRTLEERWQVLSSSVGAAARETRERLEVQVLIVAQLERQHDRLDGEAREILDLQQAGQASLRYAGVLEEFLGRAASGGG